MKKRKTWDQPPKQFTYKPSPERAQYLWELKKKAKEQTGQNISYQQLFDTMLDVLKESSEGDHLYGPGEKT